MCVGLVPGPVSVTELELLASGPVGSAVSKAPRVCFTWRRGALLGSCERNHRTFSLPISSVTWSFLWWQGVGDPVKGTWGLILIAAASLEGSLQTGV